MQLSTVHEGAVYTHPSFDQSILPVPRDRFSTSRRRRSAFEGSLSLAAVLKPYKNEKTQDGPIKNTAETQGLNEKTHIPRSDQKRSWKKTQGVVTPLGSLVSP